MHKNSFLCNKRATATSPYSRIPGMSQWCKVEGRTWIEINRGFNRIKSLKRRHLNGYRSPLFATAMGLWPGIRVFLRERISRYSSEVSGAGHEDRSRNGALRTYASVCSTLEPLENRWTILRIRVRDATYRDIPRFSRNPGVESLFYDRDVLSRPKADLQLRLCMHTWRQDAVASSVIVCLKKYFY